MKSAGIYLLCLPVMLILNGCSLLYVTKQGVYQLRLLADAEPIEVALRSKDLDGRTRKKLELIQEVRQFAAQKLKLIVYRNYKDVALSWQNTIYTVSASPPLQFKPYQWWFPIIGSVPYKGFFDENDAKKEESALKAKGFETQKGKIHGYSTLGFFSDPVWPAMLTLSDEALIELIIHELAHTTIYFPNQTPFNETFANFVGKMGARAYLLDRFGPKSIEVKRLDDHNRDIALYRNFFYDLYCELDQLYKTALPDEIKINKKNHILHEAKLNYTSLPIDDSLKKIDWSKVNNAYLLSFKRYNQDDKVFPDLFALVLQNFEQFFDEVRFYARSSDPFGSLRTRIRVLLGELNAS